MLIALINEVQKVEYISRISNERIDSVIVDGEIQLFFFFLVVNFPWLLSKKKLRRRRQRALIHKPARELFLALRVQQKIWINFVALCFQTSSRGCYFLSLLFSTSELILQFWGSLSSGLLWKEQPRSGLNSVGCGNFKRKTLASLKILEFLIETLSPRESSKVEGDKWGTLIKRQKH